MVSFPDSDDPRGVKLAGEWLSYLHSGRATEDGRQAFEGWLAADPEHARAYAKLELIWRDLPVVDTLAEVEAPVRTGQASGGRGRNGWWVAVAGGAMAAAAALVLTVMPLISRAPETATPLLVFETDRSVVETQTLADGTQITLGALTRVEVDYDEGYRRINLASGELFIDAASEPDRPLDIIVNATHVRVTGTQFDVRRAPGGVRVSVLEGSVDVFQKNGPMARLVEGQGLRSYNRGGLSDIEQMDPSTIASWRSGRLVYSDDTLEDVIFDVNRYAQIPIRFGDEDLRNIRVTTSLRTDQVDEMLGLLEATQPIEVDRSLEREWVLRRR